MAMSRRKKKLNSASPHRPCRIWTRPMAHPLSVIPGCHRVRPLSQPAHMYPAFSVDAADQCVAASLCAQSPPLLCLPSHLRSLQRYRVEKGALWRPLVLLGERRGSRRVQAFDRYGQLLPAVDACRVACLHLVRAAPSRRGGRRDRLVVLEYASPLFRDPLAQAAAAEGWAGETQS